jgi:hypothetical protein
VTGIEDLPIRCHRSRTEASPEVPQGPTFRGLVTCFAVGLCGGDGPGPSSPEPKAEVR